MNIIKQSTAATIKLGPFVDDTDGKTAETALTIGQADIRLSKNGGDIAQSHNTAGATHDELGYYDIPLGTTDTGTLGRLRVLVSKAGALPVWQDFVVVTANVYDSMFSTDKLDVAVVEMATDVLTAAAVKADAVTKIQNGLATPTNITAGTITTVTNLTNLPTMPTDWLTAAGLKADAVTKIQSGLALEATLTAIKGAGWTNQTLVKIVTDIAAIQAGSGATPQQIWEYATRVLTAGTNIDLSSLATATDLATVDTVVDAIKAKTDNLPASPAAVGSAMTLTPAYDKAKDDVLTPLGVVDGIVDAIKVQTDKIPATPASAGEYTTNIGAIKAKTDNLPLSPASSGEYTSALTAIQNDLDNPNQYKADVSNLALEATLTAIKGAEWSTQTLSEIVTAIYNVDTLINQLRTQDGYNLEDILIAIAAIQAGSGATAQEVWEYATRVLTAGTNINLPGLATAADLATLDGKVDIVDGILDDLHDTDIPAIKAETAAIKAKTDLIPASPAEAGEYTAAIAAVKSVADDILVDTGTTLDALIKDIPTNAELATALGTADDAVLAAVAAAKVVIDDIHNTDLPAVKAETALIVEDTGTTIPATLATITGYTDGIAGDVWSHATRTLTVPAVAMSDPEDGTTLTLYKDADINIEFTGLTIPTGAKKVVFTIKDNLDDADTAAALQATYQLTAVPAETHTLNYINSATPPTLTNPVTFTVTTDSVEFDMTAAAAYYLPRYERGYLKWDLKLITATTVQILQQGLVQILGTSTRTVA